MPDWCTDREKTIKGLENLRDICKAKSDMSVGEGKIVWAGYAKDADDAIAILKEQEAVKIEVKKINGNGRGGRCPNCLIRLHLHPQVYGIQLKKRSMY